MDRSRKNLSLGLALALAVLTIAVYAPVREFKFLNYDDNVYVVGNPHIGAGVTSDNIVWSMTAFENGNWHPLTLISHMLDVDAFGQDAGGHHAMNLALHVVNVLLLFWLLAVTTEQVWPAAYVAALFAVHPLNVQTVAWISERKSLLSTAFWLLALLAHARYRRRADRNDYVLVVVFAALALASKPMAVTLPLTLILFDIWPLATRPKGRGSLVQRYARELAPFAALALACGVLTLMAQRAAQALQTVTAYPWPVRLGSAIVSYAWYLKTMIWPVGLAVFYPHPVTTLAAGEVVVSLAVIVAISAFVVLKGRAFPALEFGWWWYAGTLLPVAGLIQVGSQAYADRYAYVPLIGIFVIVVWTCVRVAESKSPIWGRGLAAAGVVCIAALSLVTRAQLPYWHDSVALFRRAIDAVPDNALAHNNLGVALVDEGKISEALDHFQRAVAIAPWDTDAQSNVGNALRGLGRQSEAVEAYKKALEQAPNDATTHYNLATALADLERTDEAVTHLTEAVRLNPDYVKAHNLLGILLYKQGRLNDSLAQFRELLRLNPQDARAAEVVGQLQAHGAR
jgi:predicted TPR repeat methyltransferase